MQSVNELIDRLIDLSFAEDIGDGDHTTLCCIPEEAMGKSHLLIKEDGILAGVEIAKEVFARFDPTMVVEVLSQGSSWRYRNGCNWQGKVFVADRAPYAQYHAAYERYCHNDPSLCRTYRRYWCTCSRHT